MINGFKSTCEFCASCFSCPIVFLFDEHAFKDEHASVQFNIQDNDANGFECL